MNEHLHLYFHNGTDYGTNAKKIAIAGVFYAVAAEEAILSAVLIYSLEKSNILHTMQEALRG